MQWLVSRPHLSAGIVFGVFVLAYLWPVLVAGHLLSPRSVMFQYAPWAASRPAGWERTTNFILGDVPISHYPFHILAREFIREGTFPAWSQHAYGGVPFFANPQTLILSPFALPVWLLPLELGIGVSAALKLWVAAFGMYVLARELELDFLPAVLGGISFCLSAFSVVWLTHETLLAVAAILPWNIWLVERIVRTGRPWPAIGLVLTTALIMTGGHPGTQVHVMLATGIYALIRALNLPGLARRERLRRLAFIGAAAVVGVLLLAVLLIPVLKAGTDTIGVQARTGVNPSIPGAELPFGTIRTALFPDWWGRPSRLSLEGPANYNERTFYAGAVATIFAAIGLISAGSWRRKAPFALFVVLGLAVPLHAPGLFWLATNLPILDQVQFQRMMLLFSFGVAVLAAFGLQAVLDAREREQLRAGIVLAVALAVGLAAIGAAGVTGGDISKAAGNILHLRHAMGTSGTGAPPPLGMLAATSVGWWLVVVAGAALAVGALWRWPHRWPAIVVGLLLLAALDLQYFAHDYQPMEPAARVSLPRTPAVRYLQRRSDEGRIVGIYGTMLQDYSSVYGLRDARGTDPPQPDLRWYHLWKTLVNVEQLDWAQALLFAMPDRSNLNALSVLGTRFVVADPGTDRSTPELTRGYDGPDATVFLNREMPPRALVAPHVVLSSGEAETIATIGNDGFNPLRDVVVERSEPEAAKLARTSAAGSSVRILGETTTTVTLGATLRQRGLVVLNDRLAPGWSVRVDGHAAKPVRVNDVMRGVAAGPGRHEIVWSYRVPGLRLGLAVSLGAMLCLLCAVGVLLSRNVRARAPRSG